MKRSAVQVAVIALLAVAAIVAAAGTLDDVQSTGDAGPEDPNVVDPTATETESTVTQTGATQSQRQFGDGRSRCIEWLQTMPAVLGILLGWALIVGLVYRRYGAAEAAAAFMLVAILLFFTYPILSTCQVDRSGEPQNRSGEYQNVSDSQGAAGPGGSGSGSDDSGPTTPDVPLAVVAILGILAAAAVGGVLVTRDDDEDDDPFSAVEEAPEDEYEDADVDGFAAAAGRAADRIEDADDVDNEIYRAWVEMTEYLDVDHPQSSTPGEFAAAAVDAGVDRDDVVELTTLFEGVRYGSEPATPDRERRALDALRRIDDQYGGDGS